MWAFTLARSHAARWRDAVWRLLSAPPALEGCRIIDCASVESIHFWVASRRSRLDARAALRRLAVGWSAAFLEAPGETRASLGALDHESLRAGQIRQPLPAENMRPEGRIVPGVHDFQAANPPTLVAPEQEDGAARSRRHRLGADDPDSAQPKVDALECPDVAGIARGALRREPANLDLRGPGIAVMGAQAPPGADARVGTSLTAVV